MHCVYWTSQTVNQLPENLHWLSEKETLFYNSLRFPKRRQEWLLGRWTAKYLLQKANPDCRSVDLGDISILKAENGVPCPSLKGGNLNGMLSISHRSQMAVAAWCPHPQLKIGIDLEEIETKQDNFIHDFFTSNEAGQVFALPPAHKAWSVSLIWSAKEAVLKACQTGLSLDTRQIEIGTLSHVDKTGWQVIPILRSPSQMKHQTIIWLPLNNQVLTMALLSDEVVYAELQISAL